MSAPPAPPLRRSPAPRRRRAAGALGLSLALGACGTPGPRPEARAPRRPPNVVLIVADDQGFGDLGCYGHPTLATPHLDALAAEGVRLTQFVVASPVCSPSRAALLTGAYPKRLDMHEHVVFPPDDHGLHPDEVTLAEVLRDAGYATGCFGKWHLGHRPGLLPTDQGFDAFLGVPYSNDMSRVHRAPDAAYPYHLPVLEGPRVVEWEPDQRTLTRRYTDAAVAFVEAHADQPFFVYLPHTMPHIPLYVAEDVEGTSARGLYGDVIEDLDRSVGALVAALERLGLREDTLVLYTSDNGPWLPFGLQGGSAGPLRGGKGTNWEGGHRVPFVASWPGTLPAGHVSHELVTAMDLLPTLAALAGTTPPADRVLDGHDVGPVLRGAPGARSPTEAFLYYTRDGALAGVRRGPWKLLLEPEELYHVEHDVGEAHDRADAQPELVAELRALAHELDAEITAGMRPRAHVAATLFDPAACTPVVAPEGR